MLLEGFLEAEFPPGTAGRVSGRVSGPCGPRRPALSWPAPPAPEHRAHYGPFRPTPPPCGPAPSRPARPRGAPPPPPPHCRLRAARLPLSQPVSQHPLTAAAATLPRKRARGGWGRGQHRAGRAEGEARGGPRGGRATSKAGVCNLWRESQVSLFTSGVKNGFYFS